MAEAKFAPVCDMEEESGWDDEEWKEQGGAQEVTVPVGPNCDVKSTVPVSLALLLFLFRTVGTVLFTCGLSFFKPIVQHSCPAR